MFIISCLASSLLPPHTIPAQSLNHHACPLLLGFFIYYIPRTKCAGVVELADLPAGRQARTIIMYYVYVIRSLEKKYLYVGLTNNPDRRITEHNAKKERTTRFYVPFETIVIEKFSTRVKAREREKYLKSGTGKEYLKSF